jgi:hypothetical protein
MLQGWQKRDDLGQFVDAECLVDSGRVAALAQPQPTLGKPQRLRLVSLIAKRSDACPRWSKQRITEASQQRTLVHPFPVLN